MDKTFTLLQILSLPTHSLQEEDIDQITCEMLTGQDFGPKESTISFILHYARSIQMISTEQTGHFDCPMN